MEKTMKRKNILIIIISLLVATLLTSIGFNIYQAFFSFDSYLQSTDEIYILEAGILRNNIKFREGTDIEIKYDFENENYKKLEEKYNISGTAKDGTEFEKALRLMNEYAPRLTHESYYDNHIEMNALALLEYSLNNKSHGINCRSKAQILNEMCLSLGIYSRKVWICPNSIYDNDSHVVNEIYDTTLEKWIMLDITNNEYWVDENNVPLSVLEIRYKAAMNEFCTPVAAGDNLKDLEKLKEKHIGDFLYIIKNLTYMQYLPEYTANEDGDIYLLFPKNIDTKYELIISEDSVTRSPIK